MIRAELLARLEGVKLQKVKSHMIRQALKTGASERGNHVVTTDTMNICFFYRGIHIAHILIDTLDIKYLDVGEYEHTASTSYHRKTISDAITEIKRVTGEGMTNGQHYISPGREKLC